MKHTTDSRRVETQREREFELFAIRRSFDELRDKFLQLENAFGMNLRVQFALEKELEILKLGEASSKLKKNVASEMENTNIKAPMRIYSSVKNIRTEKDRWKEAFIRQKKITETQKLKNSHVIEAMRNECESILKTCRESGEKHFRELLYLYEDSQEKVKLLVGTVKAVKARESSTQERILELANLFETLEKFDGVRIEMLCRRSAEALRSLLTADVELHEEKMRKLRQVTWDIRDNYDDHESRELLQEQNSVLRQVVKSLKRKFQEKFHRVNENFPVVVTMNNDCEGNFEDSGNAEQDKSMKSIENSVVTIRDCGEKEEEEAPIKDVDDLVQSESKRKIYEDASRNARQSLETFGVRGSSTDEILASEAQTSRQRKQSGKQDPIFNRIYTDVTVSQRNGIPYEEYTVNLFNDRKLKIRHCNALERKGSTLRVEIVDSENRFQEAPLDRTVLYLGDRVDLIVGIEKSAIQSGNQSNGVKNCQRFVQTTVTGIKGFSRMNVGSGMLNTEKRAIERSLVKLEKTLSSLKKSALDEARSTIGRDAKMLGNEFFNCVRRLER